MEEQENAEKEEKKQEIEKFLRGIKPRAYQQNIFETACKKNTLVVLPTGMGKTLCVLMLAIERLQKYPESKVVFLAPTKPLAEQHLNYFKKYLPELFADMVLFTGKVKAEKRKELWQKANIIFSTPQCLKNDIKNELYNLKDTSLLAEDECHRCLKNYDYVYVVREYLKQAENARVLGLTASPGSKPAVIKEICKNLNIEAVEGRTRYSEDVKPYIQKLEQEIVKVDLPKEFVEIKKLLEEQYKKKVEELKNRKLLFKPATKKNLIELQGYIMGAIASGNRHFNLLAGASACAQTIKLQHALELLETQGIFQLHNYMLNLFKQAKEEKSKAVKQLVKNKEFSKAYIKTSELNSKNIVHPKLTALQEIVEREMQEKQKKKKIIVFAQYRESVARICKELNSIEGVNAKVFIGQARKGDSEAERGLTQQEQQEIIKNFSVGEVNCLVCTSIGEEGLDLPEVYAVIFYEPIPSAIRSIQRRGRTARLKPGKLIILMTKKTRDEAYYWAAYHKERKMHGVLKGVNEELEKKGEKKKQKKIEEFL